MTVPARRLPAWIPLAAIGVATCAASFGIVVNATSAAMSGPGRDAVVPHVSLTDRGVAAVSVPAMIPGQTVTRCFVVESDDVGDVRSPVGVHGVFSGELAGHLAITIRHGEPDATCSEPGAVTDVFAGRLTDFGHDATTASRGHRPAARNRSVPYLVDVTLDDAVPNSAQGTSATLDIVWEVRPPGPD